jgi:hypothetical protein
VSAIWTIVDTKKGAPDGQLSYSDKHIYNHRRFAYNLHSPAAKGQRVGRTACKAEEQYKADLNFPSTGRTLQANVTIRKIIKSVFIGLD